MRTVIVGDAHLLGPDDPEQVAFCTWLRALQADHLVLIGDIFHAGWTWAGQPAAAHAPVFDLLERWVAAGSALTWLVGNHDFGVRPTFPVDRRGAHVLSSGPLRLLVAHGDEGDRSLGYRVTRGTLHSRPFRALVDGLGPRRGQRLLERLAGGRHATPDPPGALVQGQRQWAAARLREGGIQGVAMGHSHHLEAVTLEQGTLWHTGAWLGHRSWLEIDDGVGQLYSGWPAVQVAGAPNNRT